MKFFLELSNICFQIWVEDRALAADIGQVFAVRKDQSRHTGNLIEIKGGEDAGYSVFYEGREIRSFLKKAEAVYCMEQTIGNKLCSCVTENVCILHAASVRLDDSVISFTGVSGSGKTSLALLFSKYGYYMGDEYAYLDIETGVLWHERLPFQLKKKNTDLLQKFAYAPKLAAENEIFGKAYYIPFDAANPYVADNARNKKLEIVVFPHFDSACTQTDIDSFPIKDLPQTILASLIGVKKPALLLREFLIMSAKKRIRFLSVRFSDGEDAALKLFEYIKNVEKRSGHEL